MTPVALLRSQPLATIWQPLRLFRLLLSIVSGDLLRLLSTKIQHCTETVRGITEFSQRFLSVHPRVRTDPIIVEVAIHTILYVRQVYPAELFIRRKKYDTPVFQSRHPALNAYVSGAVKAVGEELLQACSKCCWSYTPSDLRFQGEFGQSRRRDQEQRGESPGKIRVFGGEYDPSRKIR